MNKETIHKAIIEHYTDSKINNNNFFAPRIFFLNQNKKAYIEMFSIKTKKIFLYHYNGEGSGKDNYYEIILFHTIKYQQNKKKKKKRLLKALDNIQKEFTNLTPFHSFKNKRRMFYAKIIIIIYSDSKDTKYISHQILNLVKYSKIRETTMFRYFFIDYLIFQDEKYIYQEESEIFNT